MDWTHTIQAALMGIVEGLTEFLPISSTGHLILAGTLLGVHDERGKVFEIAIQSGAILAVILLYWQKLSHAMMNLPRRNEAGHMARRFIGHVMVAFVPAAVLATIASTQIKAYLFTPPVVALAFIVGGLLIFWIERLVATRPQTAIASDSQMTWRDALKVGLVQCVAMIPGTSRSGATILGGMWLGLSRQYATDFSFFLAIPTLIAAGIYSLIKARAILHAADIAYFATGTVFAFVSAWFCVRWLLRFVATSSFVPFAWYRIAFGIVVLLTWKMDWVRWSA